MGHAVIVRPPVMLRAAASEAFQAGVVASWYCEKSVSSSDCSVRTPTTALVTLLARLQLTRGVLGLMSMASEYISAMSSPCKHTDGLLYAQRKQADSDVTLGPWAQSAWACVV